VTASGMHVALCVDRAVTVTAAVVITSMLEHASHPGRIAIHLVHDVSKHAIDRFERLVGRFGSSLKTYRFNPDSHFELPQIRHLSRMAYTRLLLPEILPQEVDHVLYLDTDLIIMRDVLELEHFDFNGCLVGATLDTQRCHDPVLLKYCCDELNIPKQTPYFNSAVLIIDLRRWRNSGTASTIVSFHSKYADQLIAADQDGLNAVVRGQFAKLGFEWNYRRSPASNETRAPRHDPLWQIYFDWTSRPDPRPVVYHMTGRNKPWLVGRRHVMRDLWYGFAYRSRFYGLWTPAALTSMKVRALSRSLGGRLRSRCL